MIVNKITKNPRFYMLFGVLLLLFSLFALSGTACGRAAGKTRTVFSLDTVVSVTYYDDRDAEAVGRALELVFELEKVFSRTDPESELFRLNASLSAPVPVSDALFHVLSEAIRLSEWSDGAFDATLGSVTDLYGFGSETPKAPDGEALKEALSHTGYRKLQLDPEAKTVRSEDPALSIDLGGIAKGYIADRMKTLLTESGVRRAIINLGGNVLLIGDKPFSVGIRNPESEKPFQTLYLADLSAVTSGTYERSFEEGGRLYHHILDPKTGLPVRNGLLSVTVVARDSMISDALSTALFVLGEEDASALLARFEDVSAYFVTEDGTVNLLP